MPGGPVARVNSLHNQVCDQLGKGLRVAAICEADGLIEAIEDDHESARLFGVQWHPELLATTGNLAAKALFTRFVEERRSAGSDSAVTKSSGKFHSIGVSPIGNDPASVVKFPPRLYPSP